MEYAFKKNVRFYEFSIIILSHLRFTNYTIVQLWINF